MSPIPDRLLAGLDRWIRDAIPPGDFLRCVLHNDLFGAVSRADADSEAALGAIIRWLVQYAPRESWGSADVCRRWCGDSSWSPHSHEESNRAIPPSERCVLEHERFVDLRTSGSLVVIRLQDGVALRSVVHLSREKAFQLAGEILEEGPR